MTGHVSIRAYARSRKARGLAGTSHVAVLAAIKSGRLVKAVVRDAERKVVGILPEVADAEWTRNTDPTQSRGPETAKPMQRALFPGAELPRLPRPSDAAGQASPDAVARIQESRAVQHSYEALMAQLDYEERVGNLVAADVARRAAVDAGRAIADRLDALADSLPPLVLNLRDQHKARAVIKGAVEKVRADLAEHLRKLGAAGA
jgi:hypothetical protein